MFHGNEPNVGRYALKCLGMLKSIPSLGPTSPSPHAVFSALLSQWVSFFPIGGRWTRFPEGGYWVLFVTRLFFLIKPSEDLATGWWFFTNPFEKYAQVKLGSSSPIRGENNKYSKPPPRQLLHELVEIPVLSIPKSPDPSRNTFDSSWSKLLHHHYLHLKKRMLCFFKTKI